METAIYSDYEPHPVSRGPGRPRTRPLTSLGRGCDSAPKGPFGLEPGQVVKVAVDIRRPANPRLIYCLLKAPDGVERRILVKVGRNANFRPRMELEVTVPLVEQQNEPYEGPMPRFRGIWGVVGPRGRAAG
jgi:hypothetical protein